MRDYIVIGCTPSEEECAQVGEPDFRKRAFDEMRRFIGLIRKKLGPEPPGAKLGIKWFPHDFGEYGEVVCHFDTNNAKARTYAFMCEAMSPTTWQDDTMSEKERLEFDAAMAEAQEETEEVER